MELLAAASLAPEPVGARVSHPQRVRMTNRRTDFPTVPAREALATHRQKAVHTPHDLRTCCGWDSRAPKPTERGCPTRSVSAWQTGMRIFQPFPHPKHWQRIVQRQFANPRELRICCGWDSRAPGPVDRGCPTRSVSAWLADMRIIQSFPHPKHRQLIVQR